MSRGHQQRKGGEFIKEALLLAADPFTYRTRFRAEVPFILHGLVRNGKCSLEQASLVYAFMATPPDRRGKWRDPAGGKMRRHLGIQTALSILYDVLDRDVYFARSPLPKGGGE